MLRQTTIVRILRARDNCLMPDLPHPEQIEPRKCFHSSTNPSGAAHKYVICRILGNELPPRDDAGSRLKIFEYIIENEYLDVTAKRLWVLNRILDNQGLNRIRSRLKEIGEDFIQLEVDWNRYSQSFERDAKLTTLIGINQARNEGFRTASQTAEFVFILDGDCCFTRATWTETISALNADQETHPHRRYYALPIVRVQLHELAAGPPEENGILDEPVIAMRKDASELFDETIAFGRDDKVELLKRLGLRCWQDRWHALSSEGPCLVAGKVIHCSTGSKSLDTDSADRWVKRKQSLDRLLTETDKAAGLIILRHKGLRFYYRFILRSMMAGISHQIRTMPRPKLPRLLRQQISRLISLITR